MALPSVTELIVTSKWGTAHADTETADNAGSPVKNPNALASAAHRLLKLPHNATTLQVRMRYDDGDTITTPPTVNVFGFDESAEALATPLGESDGTTSIQLADSADDVSDGAYEYTVPVDVVLKGHRYAIVAIEIVANAAGDDPIIQARAF